MMTKYEAFEEEERRYQDAAKERSVQEREDLELLYNAFANSLKTHRLGLKVEEAEEVIWKQI